MHSHCASASARLSLLGALFLAFVSFGCGGGRGKPLVEHDAGPPPREDGAIGCEAAGVTCMGPLEVTCSAAGAVASTRNCSTAGQVCSDGRGCVTCEPGSRSCDGNKASVCRADGSGRDIERMCDGPGEGCNPSTGMCENLCEAAEASSSYIGCDYWPVTSLNQGVPTDFEFAVVVANPQVLPAQVVVTRNGTTVATRTVAPMTLEAITLPWVTELKGTDASNLPSVLVRGGAYHLRSTVPVTVYQFNALEYRIGRDCVTPEPDTTPDGQCFSYSNDASLLLPTHVLTGNYLVVSRPTLMSLFRSSTGMQTSVSPGYFAVVGADPTPVTVNITFKGNVQASIDGTIRGFHPGERGSFTLNQGDVLQITSLQPTTCDVRARRDTYAGSTVDYCLLGDDYDLTGTEIRASGKVAVVSGHNCDFVPYYRWACDHLEEQLFPLETWGEHVVVSVSKPLRAEPNVVRVLSSHDGNEISFEPPVHAPVTLARGQYVEFESAQDFRVNGTDGLLVTQFLVGQDYAGRGTSGTGGLGDPSMSFGIPIEQFRTSYTFLAPTTYEMSFVNITAGLGQTVYLDGTAIPTGEWLDVGAGGHATARIPVTGGVHTVTSSNPFGIVVYGFGSYTSYMYPGGLDLQAIDTPI